jgi:chemotaxis protein CheD
MSTASALSPGNKSSFPPVLPGFSKINRYWEPKLGIAVAKIKPGEYYVGKQNEGISTVLGSCIAVCIRDPKARIGGMNHFMLPLDGKSGSSQMISNSTRYGNYAMEHLVNDILKNGGRKNRLEFKVFGGAKVNSFSNIGDKNIEFVTDYLKLEGFSSIANDVGGSCPRRILYYPLSGKLLLKRLPVAASNTVSMAEEKYNQTIKKEPVGGEVDLF